MANDDPISDSVAGRYASAFFDLAKGAGSVPAIEGNLAGLRKLIDESVDFRRVIESPVFTGDEQAKVVEVVLSQLGISGLTANFLNLIAKNGRLAALPSIISAFSALAAKDRGEVTAEVSSAVALTDEQIATLKQSLKASVGKDVTLASKVDPSLIGGLVVKIGSRMIDSSLKTKLSNLKLALNAAG